MVASTWFPGPLEVIMVLLMGGGGNLFTNSVPPLPEDPALVRAAPQESKFFAEWFGQGKPNPKSANATERLVQNQEISNLFDTVDRAITKGAYREMPPEAARVLDEGIRLAKLLLSRPGCLFLSDFTVQAQRPKVRAGLVANVGGKASEAGRSLRELEGFLLEKMARGDNRPQCTTIEVEGAPFRVLPLPAEFPSVAWG